MPVSLDQIVAATKLRVAASKRSTNLDELEQRAQAHVPRGFRDALEWKNKHGIAIIAELKKASPSRGLIRADFDPEKLAAELEAAGASALSVLTDEQFFHGSLENLRRASASTRLPCLRKDFIVDEFQLLEARANSADSVLLIVAALSPKDLAALTRRAAEFDLDVLCEVHDEKELQIASDAGCNLIGVNNRDLKTFKVDLETALRLAQLIPKDVLSVAESGINTGADIFRLRTAGFRALLIGESLMRAEKPGEALRKLLAEASGVASSL
ncbi:MAG TPA: indole-3-glycerol phosphate synthase TrpC [Terriglobales bacterium]|nr:indole-3-glycerol phosphate synthase TrpC [Terriglobales bacterium]